MQVHVRGLHKESLEAVHAGETGLILRKCAHAYYHKVGFDHLTHVHV